MGWTSVLANLPYGDRFRKHRRLVQEYFHPRVLRNYYPMIELEVVTFVEELVKTPNNLRARLKR
jgi:cytochrome P450